MPVNRFQFYLERREDTRAAGVHAVLTTAIIIVATCGIIAASTAAWLVWLGLRITLRPLPSATSFAPEILFFSSLARRTPSAGARRVVASEFANSRERASEARRFQPRIAGARQPLRRPR